MALQRINLVIPDDLKVDVLFPQNVILNDYNKLQNIPTFEGQPIKGNLTFQSTGIAPLESLDVLMKVVNQKANTVDVQNACVQLQEQISTNKNDIAGLGDQVAEIEAKIPEDATEQNQLVTKTQMETAIASAGGDVDLTGYYNTDNLLGEEEIEIIPQPVEGGIDEDTLAVFHFDDSFSPYPFSNLYQGTVEGASLSNEQIRFGSKSLKLSSGGQYFRAVMLDWDLFASDFTLDFWHRISSNLGVTICGFSNSQTANDVRSFPFKITCGSLSSYSHTRLEINNVVLNANKEEPVSQWNHIAVTFEKATNTATLYLNGEMYGSTVLTSVPSGVINLTFYEQSSGTQYIDEVRISNVIRYHEDFTPPTKAYSVAVPTGKYVVRNKTKLVHKSDIGMVGGAAALDENGKVPASQLPASTAQQISSTDLPDASTMAFQFAYLSDKSMLVFSNGVSWQEVVTTDLV